jgi:hypothetical protein
MQTAEQLEDRGRISVGLPPDLHSAISTKAKETGLSMNRTILQLIRTGLEAERQKKQRLEEMLIRYRECTDPEEAQRLGDELGAMIFGR